MSTNLGMATPTVITLPNLPNVGDFITKSNFEASAHQWDSFSNSVYFKPQLIERTVDPNGAFSVLHPSRRITWVNNYLQTDDITPADGILWTQLDDETPDGIMAEIIPEYDSYENLTFAEQAESGPEYIGPVFKDNNINRESPPDDKKILKAFIESLAGVSDDDEEDASEEDEGEINAVRFIQQTRPRDGLWWGMESSAFLDVKNTPFWVNIRTHSPPTTFDFDTIFVISLGMSDETNRYDIYLSLNNKPKLIDYIGTNDAGAPLVDSKELPEESSRIWSTDSFHRIGIMTIAGYLVVLINGNVMVHQRLSKSTGDEGGTPIPCEIAAGSIRLYGTNTSCSFNVSPMTFAYKGFIALTIADLPEGGTWYGSDEEGNESGSVCELPTPPSITDTIFGCDCEEFTDESGSASPSGEGFHQQGYIDFYKSAAGTFAALPSTSFYVLEFNSTTTTFNGADLKNGGCPYFFRIKGVSVTDDAAAPEEGEGVDITDYVISINETCNAPDYFHAKKSVDIVCYDPNGEVSDALLMGQSGVEVKWGWDGDNEKTFTGVVASVSTSQKAGMETVSIRAEDYFFIIKNTPIINSPFYDGMVAYHAIADMASRASLEGFVNKWETPEDSFLPAGSSFSKPAMRYSGTQTIFDCMIDVVKRYEAFLHFDENGALVITRLPGGLFSEGSGSGSVASFVSDPTAEAGLVILDEKQAEMNYESTVNVISAMTVERQSRNPIIHSKVAEGAESHLLFKKVYLVNQAAYGSIEVCRDYVEQLSLRMFFPILKTRWKVAGTSTAIQPLSFVDVDGQKFRVMSMKRSFNAESNDLTTDYEGEWLGGA